MKIRSVIELVLMFVLAFVSGSAQGGECLWRVTLSDSDGRLEGTAYACLFAAGVWDSLEALDTAIQDGTFRAIQAAATFQLTPGTSEQRFVSTGENWDFFHRAVYVVFSSSTAEGSRYYEVGWADLNSDSSDIESSNRIGYYVDEQGEQHPVNCGTQQIGLSRERNEWSGSIPEPSSAVLLLFGFGMLGLKRTHVKKS